MKNFTVLRYGFIFISAIFILSVATKIFAQCADNFCVYLPVIIKPALPGSFAQNSWPTVFQNYSRSGRNIFEQELNRDAISNKGLQLAWTYDLSYTPDVVSPIIATDLDGKSGVVYFPDNQIISLDLETGQPLTLTLSYRSQNNITIDEQNLYYSGYVNGEYHIIAANRHNGDTLWSYKMLDSSSSAPTLYQDTVYVLSSDKNIYALNKNDGTLRWKFLTGDRFLNQTAAISGSTLYAKNESDSLYALNVETGQLLWSYPLDSYAYTSPTVYGNSVIIVDTNSVKAINGSDGILKWEFESLWDRGVQFYYGAPAIFSDTVYIHGLHTITSTNASRIFALNADTGTLVWQKEMSAALESSISIADKVLFIGADDNRIYALDVADGNELWSYQTDYYVRTFPAVANGKLIFGSYDKKLYAFEVP